MHSRTLQSIKAIFWDIDGTLIDSESLHYRAIAEWCEGRGCLLTHDDNSQLLGRSMREKWDFLTAEHHFDETFEDFCKDCSQYYCSHLHRVEIRPGPVQVLKNLATLNLPQACVSNGDSCVVECNLDHLGITEHIAFFISGDDLIHGKPHPEPYLLAAKRFNLPPEACLAVEDSEVGVTSASAAGVITVAWPTESSDTMVFTSADYTVTGFHDFPWMLLQDHKV